MIRRQPIVTRTDNTLSLHDAPPIVLAEARDRVSRDQADVAILYKHLKVAGVRVVTLAEGEISELHVGLKGTMNALFLKDLAAKTHRGLRGRVEKGKAGGGLCYGYSVVKRLNSEGEQVRGERNINEAEAVVVRRIFREFAAGKSRSEEHTSELQSLMRISYVVFCLKK